MDDIQLTGWFYLSFVQGEGPDELFAGGCIVKADDMIPAVEESLRKKCHLGGQVAGMPIPEGFLPDDSYRERVLTKAEIQAFWPDAQRIGDTSPEEEGTKG